MTDTELGWDWIFDGATRRPTGARLRFRVTDGARVLQNASVDLDLQHLSAFLTKLAADWPIGADNRPKPEFFETIQRRGGSETVLPPLDSKLGRG